MRDEQQQMTVSPDPNRIEEGVNLLHNFPDLFTGFFAGIIAGAGGLLYIFKKKWLPAPGTVELIQARDKMEAKLAAKTKEVQDLKIQMDRMETSMKQNDETWRTVIRMMGKEDILREAEAEISNGHHEEDKNAG